MKKLLFIFMLLFTGCIAVVDVGPPGTQAVEPLPKTAGGLPEIYPGVVFVNTNSFAWDEYNYKEILIALFDFNEDEENKYIANLNTIYDSLNTSKGEVIGIHVSKENITFSLAQLRKTMTIKKVRFPVIVDADHLLWAGLGRYKKPFLVRVNTAGNIQKFITDEEILAELQVGYRTTNQGRVTTAILEPDILCGAEKGKISNSADMHAYVPFIFKHDGEFPVAGIVSLEGEWTARKNSYYCSNSHDSWQNYIGFRFYSPNVSVLAQQGTVKVTLDGKTIPKQYKGGDIQTDVEGTTYAVTSGKRIYDLVKGLPWSSTGYTLKVYPQENFEIFRILFPVADNWKRQ